MFFWKTPFYQKVEFSQVLPALLRFLYSNKTSSPPDTVFGGPSGDHYDTRLRNQVNPKFVKINHRLLKDNKFR